MKKFMAEFKEFIMTGNVIDLAIGVVIGSAFTAIVSNLVEGLITPLVGWVIAIFTGSTDQEESLGALKYSPAKGVTFDFGIVIGAIITFLITGLVLFLVVKAINRAKALKKTPVEATEAPQPTAEEYLAEIRDLLRLQSGLPPVDEEKDPK